MRVKKVDWNLASEMRANGCTFREIADRFGVSKQYIQSMEHSRYNLRRKDANFIDKIPYPVIRKCFETDRHLTIPTFARAVYSDGSRATQEKAKTLLLGGNVMLTVCQLRKVLAVTGKTFEETFYDERTAANA